MDIHQSAKKVKKEVDKTAREGIEAYFSDVLDNEVSAMSTDPELRALGSSIGVVTHQHMQSINGLRVEMSGELLKTRVRPLLAQARASKFHLSLSERLGRILFVRRPLSFNRRGNRRIRRSLVPATQPDAYRVRRGT